MYKDLEKENIMVKMQKLSLNNEKLNGWDKQTGRHSRTIFGEQKSKGILPEHNSKEAREMRNKWNIMEDADAILLSSASGRNQSNPPGLYQV